MSIQEAAEPPTTARWISRDHTTVWAPAVATVVAGVILVITGWRLAAVISDDAPWIGSWLDGVFGSVREFGWNVIAIGIVWCVLNVLGVKTVDGDEHDPPPELPYDERIRAIAQRTFNPPYPPKPDWGQTLRGLGLFAALVAAVWYQAGAPPVDGNELNWLRDGFEAYGSGLLTLGGALLAWSVLAGSISARHSFTRWLLELPLGAVWWLLHQIALIVGLLVFALVAAGVTSFAS
jgi:hypothetical protein